MAIEDGLDLLMKSGVISKETYERMRGVTVRIQIPEEDRRRLLMPEKTMRVGTIDRDVAELQAAMRNAGSLSYHQIDRAWDALERVMSEFESGPITGRSIFVIGTAYNAYIYAQTRNIEGNRMRSFKLANRTKMAMPHGVLRVLMLGTPDAQDATVLKSLLSTDRHRLAVCICIRHNRIDVSTNDKGELVVKEEEVQEVR